MSEVQQLYRLQEIDSEIQEKRQRLSEVLQAQKENRELVRAQERAEAAAAKLQQWHTRQTDLSLELESLNNKAKRSEERLYSGRVTNPKELTDLQNEIASLGRRRDVLEDKVLEAMIMLEEIEAEQSAAEESLSQIEAEWKETLASLKQDQSELALRLHELTSMRQKQISLVSESALADYERVAQQRTGLAVVTLRGNICQGCQLNVSANTVKAVREGTLVHCPSCGRILTMAWQ